jgi:glyoxylase-like metal-dependent hydrolase (beta-lactamase superfamily II)
MTRPPTEILPGLVHWTAIHPRIHSEVSSYWLESGVAIDPLLDATVDAEWFAAREPAPAAVLLTNRHHYRSSGELRERFGCEVLCNAAGLHEFAAGQEVRGFSPGDALPGPALACEVDAICPDDSAIFLPEQRAIAFADAVVLGGGGLGFVPDQLMDEPELTKRGILAALAALLDDERLDFEHLLLAHGGPVLGDGRAQLEALVESGGRTAFEF